MRRAQDRARSARCRKNGARSATIKSRALGALKLASESRDENVPAKRADFFVYINVTLIETKKAFQTIYLSFLSQIIFLAECHHIEFSKILK